MIIAGLNFAHDSGVSIVDGGRVIALYQRERFTRVKRQAFMTADFLRSCLRRSGLDWRDVDFVAVSSSQSWPLILLDPDQLRLDHDAAALTDLPLKGVTTDTATRMVRHIETRRKYLDRRYTAFMNPDMRYGEYFGAERVTRPADEGYAVSYDWPVMPDWWREPYDLEAVSAAVRRAHSTSIPHWAYSPLRVTLDGISKPGVMVPHHMCHAASAYYPSDSDDAAIYTIDNGDDLHPVNGYKGGIYALGMANRLLPIGPTYDYHGHFYQRVGEGIRLGHGGAAGKLMGLAPYGAARYFDDSMVGNGIDVFGEGYALGSKTDGAHVLRRLLAAVDSHRNAEAEDLPKHSEHFVAGAHGAEDVVRPNIDLAMSAQKVFEANTLRTIRFLKAAATEGGRPSPLLALSGGGALNCPANSRIWAEGLFETVFVPPFCDDSGLALGAALALAHDVLDLPRQPMAATRGEGAYLGCAYDEAAVDAALAARADRVMEVPTADGAGDAAAKVADGRIVAWFEGRSETGPRALGHRSILADPRDATKWREVNRVKRREYWRPFAPAVLREKADDWFSGAPTPSPFMLFNAQVRSPALPAITHVDGSARIQTVDASCGGFRAVLEAFEARTGVPVVMNTSFNGPGEPIVETPGEALDFLAGSEIDAVYIHGRKFTRKP